MAKSVLIYCDSSNRGGVVTYTLSLCAALKENGFSVFIVTHERISSESRDILSRFSLVSDQVHFVDPRLRLKGIVSEVVDIAKEVKPDVFFPNYRAHSYAACTKLVDLGVKCIGVCHSEDAFSILKKYESVLSGFVCPAISSFEKLGNLISSRRKDIFYIPHCVNVVDSVKSPVFPNPLSPFKIVYHGRIDRKYKRLNLLVELAEALVKKSVIFEITLIGQGSYRDELESTVNAKGLHEVVKFLPSMEWGDLVEELSKHHCSVLLSSHEGFCLGLAEAMGVGLPAVSLTCGGAPATFVVNGYNGILIPDDCIDEMANWIKVLSSDSGQYRVMSINAKKTIRTKLSFREFSESYNDFMLEMEARLISDRKKWPWFRPIYVDSESLWFFRFVEKMGWLLRVW